MPKRHDLKKILIIGSGPIVIGQGAEFDYSGVQACKALRQIGYEIVLVNSNPATIMTDPQMADHTYIEPITWQSIANIINKERPQALLSTMGGQTALNCALELVEHGVLKKYNVELIGANQQAINKAEDRNLFRNAISKLGLETAKSFIVHSMSEALEAQQQLGFPVIIRPSYTLGGSGGGIAYDLIQFKHICQHGLKLSLNSQLLVEESLLGWKEYELEVIRDKNDNCIVVCTIENIDPMGIHTGDSITVAPAQTLTDKEYQHMRNAAFAILREIGVETGGANVQFAVDPKTGRLIVVEMNPRVSRSSALASKATGFPIAKIAALLAVGFTLDELQNDITGGLIPASFEPTLDYVVVKIPRFNFDKMPGATGLLTTQMQSVGEVMAIGTTFNAALQKAYCGLEQGLDGLTPQIDLHDANATDKIIKELKNPRQNRLLYVADAFRAGFDIEQIHNLTAIDQWFLDQIQTIVQIEKQITTYSLSTLTREILLSWKQEGFSDKRIACLLRCSANEIYNLRHSLKIRPKFRQVDSCAAEFPAKSSYLYSTFVGECEAKEHAFGTKEKVIVLGSGPNRIGQGIEFDYGCVKAIQTLQKLDIVAIMINCNPETVSTDYDTSDRLYFEPLSIEMVLEIIALEQPLGVIIQLGGQTPLKLAKALEQNGVKILGSSPDTIDLSEDRARFAKVVEKLGFLQPKNVIAANLVEGLAAADSLGFPLILRPSYVLGGRAMQIVSNMDELKHYLQQAFHASQNHPVLIDRFLRNAIEVDVDLLADSYGNVAIGGILEHIEYAGIHSGDSAMSLPAHSLSPNIKLKIAEQARALARELKVCGLMNIQFALQDKALYILEVNPRSSRTVPFVSKATGIPLIDMAVKCMLGHKLENLPAPRQAEFYAIKQSVFPFIKFNNVDPVLGPEMRSTGEIMAIGNDFYEAYYKSLLAIGENIISSDGVAYLSLDDGGLDKAAALQIAKQLLANGFSLIGCQNTVSLLDGIKISLAEDIIDQVMKQQVDLIICIGQNSLAAELRKLALRLGINLINNLPAARFKLMLLNRPVANVPYSLQELHSAVQMETA